MKFMIAIIIMFAPPNYPEGDMLIVDKQGEDHISCLVDPTTKGKVADNVR